MALLGRSQIGIREFGTSVTVPNDPRAKLMFYLDCVSAVLEIEDKVPRRLTDFSRNYNRLSNDDIVELVAHCILFSPVQLKGKCFFEDDKHGGCCNNFLELSSVQSSMLITGSVVIGGKNTRVAKIMTYTRSWMRINYEEPMLVLLAGQRRQGIRPAIQASPRYNTNPYRGTSRGNSNCCCCVIM